VSTQANEKKSAAERKEESAKRIAAVTEKMNAQQKEAIADMLEAVTDELTHTPEGDKITAIITKHTDNRLSVELESANRPRTTHYEKIVLGACRRAHIESLLSGKNFDFAIIKKKLYKQIVRKSEDDTLSAANGRRRETYEIYRNYYYKVSKARKSYRSSQELSHLQSKYDKTNIFGFAELMGVTLEGRRQKISGNFNEWVGIAIRTLLRGEE
jgi:hypothetical protein